MKSNTLKSTGYICLIAVFLFALVPAEIKGQGTPTKATTPPQPAEKLTLVQVIRLLQQISSGARDIRDVERIVRENKVNFERTEFIERLLRDLGASDEILKVAPLSDILDRPYEVVPVPITVPVIRFVEVPHPPGGTLDIQCEPKRCALIINDTYYGLFENGRTRISGIRQGKVTVTAFSEGYSTGTLPVEIREGETTEVKFELTELLVLGKARLLEAFNGLGGIEGVNASTGLEWADKLHWYDRDRGEHDLEVKVTPGQKPQVVFGSKNDQCVVPLGGAAPKPDCRGTLKNDTYVQLAGSATTGFLNNQVSAVIRLLLEAKLTSIEGGLMRLENSGGTEKYTVTLDGVRITKFTRSYSAGNYTVEYSQYQPLGRGEHPAKIQITLGDDAPQWVLTMTAKVPAARQ